MAAYAFVDTAGKADFEAPGIVLGLKLDEVEHPGVDSASTDRPGLDSIKPSTVSFD